MLQDKVESIIKKHTNYFNNLDEDFQNITTCGNVYTISTYYNEQTQVELVTEKLSRTDILTDRLILMCIDKSIFTYKIHKEYIILEIKTLAHHENIVLSGLTLEEYFSTELHIQSTYGMTLLRLDTLKSLQGMFSDDNICYTYTIRNAITSDESSKLLSDFVNLMKNEC